MDNEHYFEIIDSMKKENGMKRIWTSLFILVAYSLTTTASLADICCNRTVSSRIKGIDGIAPSDIRLLYKAVDSGFIYHGSRELDCPLSVEMNIGSDPDYLIDCSLETMNSDQQCRSYIDFSGGGGEWKYRPCEHYYIFRASLIDPHHGNAVLTGPHHVSWHGTIHDFTPYDNSGYRIRSLLKELIQYLRPFDDKIYDYERTPRLCEIDPEKDEVESKETITIHIRNIVDHQNRPSKDFQSILLKPKLGKIKNGVQHGAYYVFKVGSQASVDVIYEAPDICDLDTEIIEVYNSCYLNLPMSSVLPEEKIQQSKIKIKPKTPERFKMKYHHTMTLQYGQFLLKSTGKGKIPCTINWQETPPSIKCDGRVTADWKGHAGSCKFDGDSSFGLHYKGHVKLTEDSPSKIIIEKTGDDELGGNFNIICSGITQKVPADFPIPALEEDRKLEFDLKSGGTKSFTVPGGTTYSYNIDLKCKKKANK